MFRSWHRTAVAESNDTSWPSSKPGKPRNRNRVTRAEWHCDQTRAVELWGEVPPLPVPFPPCPAVVNRVSIGCRADAQAGRTPLFLPRLHHFRCRTAFRRDSGVLQRQPCRLESQKSASRFPPALRWGLPRWDEYERDSLPPENSRLAPTIERRQRRGPAPPSRLVYRSCVRVRVCSTTGNSGAVHDGE